MGRLRPNAASSDAGKLNGASTSRQRTDSNTEPAKKKAKFLEAEDKEVHLEAPSKSGLEALVHPLKVDTFLKRFWEPSRPLLLNRPYDGLWNAKLVPAAASLSRLLSALTATSNPAYYHTDVQLIGYSAEEDDLIFETPDEGSVDADFVKQILKGAEDATCAPSLHVSNLDLFSSELATLLTQLDERWRGDGAITTKLTVTPPGCLPFGVHVDGQAQFILQIKGTQTVAIFEHQEGGPDSFLAEADEESSFTSLTHGPCPEVVLSGSYAAGHATSSFEMTLDAGATLFLPPTVKLSQVPSTASEPSISLTIYLSPHPNWKNTLEELISMASAASSEVLQNEKTSSSGYSFVSGEDATQIQDSNDLEDSEDEEEHGEEDEEEGDDQNEENEEEGDDEDADSNLWTLFPNNLDASGKNGDRLKKTLVDVLERAAKLAPNFVDSLMANTKFTRQHFLKAIPSMTSKIGKDGIEALLKENGGLVKISNFLPQDTADAIHHLISHIPDPEWNDAYASEDAKENNIEHAFRSSRTFASHHAVFALFKRILPQCFGDFSMGKYTEGHFIAPHDDRAYKEVNGQHFSRHIAVIYYCSKDWKEEYGGQLVDMVTKKEYVPEFNSMVAFSVPRFHEVKPVLVPSLERHSIFGWFFKPGINYELWNGQEDEK